MTSNSDSIREQNDRFRQTVPMSGTIPGRLMLTQGIQALTDTDAEPAKYLLELFVLVRRYDDFTQDNDPHEEHDFGAFTFRDQKCFWKIDYFATDMMHGAEDPSDLKNTIRVLTIMLASEY